MPLSTSTRYRITMISGLFLAVVTFTALFTGMEAVAATAVAGVMTILSAYIWSQTKRPHQYEQNQSPAAKDHDGPGGPHGPAAAD